MAYIELKNVSKTVRNRALLSGINININQGSIAVFQGINGSGKTLVLKAILGLINITSGEIMVKSHNINTMDAYPIAAGILIENPSLIEEFTAYKNLKLLADLSNNIDDEQLTQLLAYFDLNKYPKQKVKKFSLGMKQKLGIAQAMLGHNELIVLDEPTNALDEHSIGKLVDLIKKRNEAGTTFIIASHDHDFIQKIATQIFSVKEGVVHEN